MTKYAAITLARGAMLVREGVGGSWFEVAKCASDLTAKRLADELNKGNENADRSNGGLGNARNKNRKRHYSSWALRFLTKRPEREFCITKHPR